MISNEPHSDRPGKDPQKKSSASQEDVGGGRMKEHLSSVADDAKEKGRSVIEGQKHQVAESIRHVCKALHGASEKLHDEHDDTVAGYTDAMGQRLEQLADYIDQTDVSDVVDRVDRFARRQPHVFLGGMFLAGLATARFLKASSSSASSEASRSMRSASEQQQRFSSSPHDRPLSTRPYGQETSGSVSASGTSGKSGTSDSSGRTEVPSTYMTNRPGGQGSSGMPPGRSGASAQRSEAVRGESTSGETGIGGLQHSPRNDPPSKGRGEADQ